MALTQEKLDAIIQYATEQITRTIENGDIYDEKNTQRMFLAVQQIYDELGAVASEQIPEMLQQAYIEGVTNAIKQLGQLGIGVLTSNMNIGNIMRAPLHTEAISNIVSDTLGDLAAAFRTAEKYSIKHIDLAIDEVKQEIANGMIVGMTDKQIAKRVGQKFGRRGMTAFVTKDGRHLPLDFYANAVTQTKIQTATNHGHLNRYEEMDVKHVIVTGNVPTCHECARYRGIVFSTKRGDPDFPHINLHKTFPKHPHCRCNFRPYIAKFKSKAQLERDKENARQFNPDKDPRSTSEKKHYDAEQKAKAKVRRKRHTFNKLQAVLGKDGPKSFTEYKNADKWQRNKWVAQLKKMYDPHQKPPKDDKQKANIKQSMHLKMTKEHPDKDAFAKDIEPQLLKMFNDTTHVTDDTKDNYAKIFNKNIDKLKFKTKPGKSAQFSRIGGVMMGRDLFDSNKLSRTETTQGVFTHEFGHAIDELMYRTISEGDKEGDRKIKADSKALHNMFDGLDLSEHVSVELQYKILKEHSDIELEPIEKYIAKGKNTLQNDIAKKRIAERQKETGEKLSASDKRFIKYDVQHEFEDAGRKFTEASNEKMKNSDKAFIHGFEQDMLDSMGFRSSVGHGSGYWKQFKPKKHGYTGRGSEAFAELSEMLADEETWDYFHEQFPHSVEIYKEILKEAQKYL